ncbi:MAG: hypothetical protein ACHREM_24445, partial [Polyangiales bacterium]
LGALFTVAAPSLAAAAAAADDAPTATATEYSALEKRLIDRTLAARGFVLETAPEGKILESIEYQPLEVFDDDDPIPDEFNVFHSKTREWILAREVLLPIGATWNQSLVDETARNIRNLIQISLAVAVPIQGTKPGTVRMLLVVRDIWSLRPDWDLQFLGGKINYLLLQPTESNLAGLHHEPQFVFLYQPLSLQTGAAYTVPRLGQSHIGVSATGGVYFPLGARDPADTQSPEGSYASLTVNQALYSSQAPWSWTLSGSFQDYVARSYQNGYLKQFLATDPSGTTTFVPFQWRTKAFTAGAGATRSLGWGLKNDFTVGFSARLRHYAPEGVEGIPQSDVQQFIAQALPTTENRVYPYARWHSYRSDFFRTIEIDSVGAQEDFRLGHDVYLEIDPISAAVGSSRSLVSILGGAMWTSRIGDGIVRGSVEGNVDTQTDGKISDALFDAKLGIVSPRTGFGRLVFNGRYIARPENYLNRLEFLGGDTRLRGYPSSLFYGSNLVAMNLEWRTRGLYKWGMAMGGVLFYDSGDAFSDPSKMQLKHSVGAGLRFLLPFFDEVAYRIDFAVPLNRGALPASAGKFDVIIAFEQAFPFPTSCANASGTQIARQCP